MTTNVSKAQTLQNTASTTGVAVQQPIPEAALVRAVEVGGSPAVLLAICFAGTVALLKTRLQSEK